MIHHGKNLLLVFLWMVFSISATYAYDILPYESGGDRVEAILPLPTIKINKIAREGTYEKVYAEPAIVLEEMPMAPAVGMKFSLAELDEEMAKIEAHYMTAATEDPVDPAFIPYMRSLAKGNYSAKAKKIKKIVDGALVNANYVDALTGGDLVTMPLVKQQMIGQKTVSIIFNKARIYPQHALLEVYIKVDMAQIDIEGNPVELYFAADDILFSQEEGIIGGTIGLVNDYALKIGNSEKAAVWLKGMTKTLKDGATGDPANPFDDGKFDKGGTYVSFDCDGFKEMGLEGEVLFSREWVIPADEQGTPLVGSAGETPRVKGNFKLVAQDMDDIYIGLDMGHFLVSKFQDVSIKIAGAYLDMSTYRNPPGIPDEYGILPDVWEGVYIKNVGITLPEPFKRTCGTFTDQPESQEQKPQTCRIKMDAQHLLIDEYGVDGLFSVSGQAPLVGGPIMDGEWGWSIHTLGLQFINSELTAFSFDGGIGVPILDKDDPLYYAAEINLGNKKEYNFTIASEGNEKKSFPIWNAAEVNFTAPPIVEVSISDGEFNAAVTMTGNLTIGNPKDKIEGEGGSLVKMPSIEFEGLKFSTRNPTFSFISMGLESGTESSSVVNFPVVPTGIALSKANNSNDIHLDFGMMVNLMETSQSTISATGLFQLTGEVTRDLSGARRWEYKNFSFSGAQVVINVPQFYGKGTLQIFENDEVYGKGFSANLIAKIMGKDLDDPSNSGKFKLEMAAIFGSSPSSTGDYEGEDEDLDNYRYWMVDGMLTSDQISVPLFGPFELNGFGGGAYYHMRPHSYNENSESSETLTALGTATTGVVYRPNANTGLGIKFSTSITMRGNLMNGLLTAMFRFSPGGGFQNLTLWGTVDILGGGTKDDRFKPDIADRVAKNTMDLEEVIEGDTAEAATAGTSTDNENESEGLDGGIKGQIGISLDFEDGFTFHGFAKVTINLKEAITGVGTMDLLLDLSDDEESVSEEGDWHIFIGGYYENDYGQQVIVPGFFDETKPVVLEPVSVRVGYGSFNVSAQAYFLTGTKIPGPPPPPQDVIEFFGEDDPDVMKSNRDKMSCGGRGPAMGTGLALGATAAFEIDTKVGGVFGSCVLGVELKVLARVGFDLALLKYSPTAACALADKEPPVGLNGYRATGRAYAMVSLEGGHITCVPLPEVGVGIKVEFDVFKPSYLDAKVTVVAFGEKGTVRTESRFRHTLNFGIYNVYSRHNPIYYDLRTRFFSRGSDLVKKRDFVQVYFGGILPMLSYSMRFQ